MLQVGKQHESLNTRHTRFAKNTVQVDQPAHAVDQCNARRNTFAPITRSVGTLGRSRNKLAGIENYFWRMVANIGIIRIEPENLVLSVVCSRSVR